MVIGIRPRLPEQIANLSEKLLLCVTRACTMMVISARIRGPFQKYPLWGSNELKIIFKIPKNNCYGRATFLL